MRLRALAIATVTGLVLSVAPTLAAEAAAKTPNRGITQVKAVGHTSATGTTVSVTAKVKNLKKKKLRAAHAPVYLVGTTRVFRMSSIKVPAIRAKGRVTARTQRKVPATVPAGQYAVRVCLVTFPDRCRTSGRTVKIAPARLAASTASLSFADTMKGTSSPSRQVRITNTGQSRTGALAVSLGSTSAFGLGDSTCRTALAPGAACSVDVLFTPQSDGLATGALEVTDGAGARTSVALAGTGTEPATLRITPSEILFASTTIGDSTEPQTLTLTNDGDYPTGTPAVGISGDNDDQFHLTGSTCVEALPAGESCTLDVIYAPASAGRATAVVTAAATPGGEVTTALTGAGQTPPALAISDESHNYGYSDQPAEHVFTITNTGDAATGVPTAIVDGATAFSVTTNTCTAVVAGGATCSVGVTYTGTGTASQSAQLRVAATRGGTVSADLTGSPVALSIAPASHDFGMVDVGSTSDAATFVLTNHRLTPIQVDGQGVNGPFSLGDSCFGDTIPAGGTCSFTATFSPTAAGPETHTVDYFAQGAQAQVELTGIGATPAALTVTPDHTDLGAWAVGDTGTGNVTITNTGTKSTEALSTSLGGTNSDDFSVASSDCPEILAGGATCTATVEFTPQDLGDKTTTLTVGGAPANTVELTGLAAPAGVSLVPASYDYGSVAVGGAAYKTFRVVNTTGNPEDMNSASSGPPFPLELNQDFTCVLVVSTIQPHRWCTMTISFKPQSAGSFSATLTAGGTNFNTSTQMSGTGVASSARRSQSSPQEGPVTFEIKDGEPVTQ